MSRDPIIEFTSQLPLAGRYLVHFISHSGADAIIKNQKSKQYVVTSLLGGLSAIHGAQTLLGAKYLLKNRNQKVTSPIVSNAVNFTYMLANGLSAYTQAKLAYSVATQQHDINKTSRSDWIENFNISNRPKISLYGKSSYSLKQTLLDVALTNTLNTAFYAVNKKRPMRSLLILQ